MDFLRGELRPVEQAFDAAHEMAFRLRAVGEANLLHHRLQMLIETLHIAGRGADQPGGGLRRAGCGGTTDA